MVISPIVRHMLICRDCYYGDGGQLLIEDLLTSIEVDGFDPIDEWNFERISVVLVFRGGRGTGLIQLSCLHDRSEVEVFSSRYIPHTSDPDPLAYREMVFEFTECHFPLPGLYVFRFWYNEDKVMDLPVVVRERL